MNLFILLVKEVNKWLLQDTIKCKYVSKKNLGRALEEIENNLIIVKKD